MTAGAARALVTGGAGFIGSTLVDRLVDEGWEALVIDDLSTGHADHLRDARGRGRVGLHTIDIRDDACIAAAEHFRPDVVFHLAAQVSVSASVLDAGKDAEVNILGTINVLEAAWRSGAQRVVLTGSAATYGSGVRLPAKESYRRKPDSPYGVSKKAIEDYARVYSSQHGLEFVILTPANVYGPRQNASGEGGVVAAFSAAITSGRQPTVFGDGSATRDFVFVDDVADGFLRAASRGKGRNLNLSTGFETSVRDLYDALAQAAGFRKRPLYGDPRVGDIQRSVLDPSAADRHLGWKAWTPLKEGLATTMEWFARK
jgi:UDP-glucose 4-epimerase